MSDHDDLFRQLRLIQARNEVLEERGVTALERLLVIGQRNSGQARRVRRFLLGLYNGPEWPLDLTELRGFDQAIQEDVLAVLAMDMAGPRKEVHEHLTEAESLLQAFWERESAPD